MNDELGYDLIVFKGSDSFQNYKSDIVDDGASEWNSVSENVSRVMKKLDLLDTDRKRANPNYVPHVRIVAGHSLGGGLAQTCAILYGLSGYVLNPLPISQQTMPLMSC